MASHPDLPKRSRDGYEVTDVVLEVMASRQIVNRITREVTLPPAPLQKLNEVRLNAFLSSLRPLTATALAILQTEEGIKERGRYKQLPYERIVIRVLSNGRVLGHINGARQTFNLRGEMISPGTLRIVDTTPRLPRQQRDERDGRN
jgi:hypothetical protein